MVLLQSQKPDMEHLPPGVAEWPVQVAGRTPEFAGNVLHCEEPEGYAKAAEPSYVQGQCQSQAWHCLQRLALQVSTVFVWISLVMHKMAGWHDLAYMHVCSHQRVQCMPVLISKPAHAIVMRYLVCLCKVWFGSAGCVVACVLPLGLQQLC